MAHYLSVPDAYPPHLTFLLADFLANTSPKDAEKAIVELFSGSGGILSKFDPKGSWNRTVLGSHCRRPHRRNVVDDGFFSEMAAGARLLSLLDIPEIQPVNPDVIPEHAVPFSKLDYAKPGDVGVSTKKTRCLRTTLSTEKRETRRGRKSIYWLRRTVPCTRTCRSASRLQTPT